MQPITFLSQIRLLVISIFSGIFPTIHGYALCKKNTLRVLTVMSSYACNDVSLVIWNLNQPFNIH